MTRELLIGIFKNVSVKLNIMLGVIVMTVYFILQPDGGPFDELIPKLKFAAIGISIFYFLRAGAALYVQEKFKSELEDF